LLEALLTFGTFERLFASMSPGVDLQLPNLPEALGAVRTTEGTLAGVTTCVALQVALLGKGSRT